MSMTDDHNHPPVASSGNQSAGAKIWLTIALLVGVWAFARLGGHPPAAPLSAVGVFAQPTRFLVTPMESVTSVNVRIGPGTQFRVRDRLYRGDQVSGVERVTDVNGDPWIKLANESGFVKESILTVAGG